MPVPIDCGSPGRVSNAVPPPLAAAMGEAGTVGGAESIAAALAAGLVLVRAKAEGWGGWVMGGGRIDSLRKKRSPEGQSAQPSPARGRNRKVKAPVKRTCPGSNSSAR